MPTLPAKFKPHPCVGNAHAQTVMSALRPLRPRPRYRRERLALPDGDFVDLDWVETGAPRTAILCHGLEGSSQAVYIRALAALLTGAGWGVLAWNYRGCGGTPNRLPRAYHSGDSPDLDAVVSRVRRSCDKIALVGLSLGGNLVLKYIGERPPPDCVRCAAAISAPIDLASSVEALESRRSSRIYMRRMVRALCHKMAQKARAFPAHIDTRQLRRMRTFTAFDGCYTAPLHGFESAQDYWKRCSARQFLHAITIPALLVNAGDDPFLGTACYPFAEARASDCLHFEAPQQGGHLGFIDSLYRPFTWAERRCVEFLEQMA